jgi:hypothetical protein
MCPPGTSSGSGNSGSGSRRTANSWDAPHAWGNSRECPYYNADNTMNRRGYPEVAIPDGNGVSATEVGQWRLGGVRRNPPPTYTAPMSLYTTPQRANSKPEQSGTQRTATTGLGLTLGPVFQGTVHEEQSHEHNPQAIKQTINTTTPTTSQTNGKHSNKNTKQHHGLRQQTPQGHEENRTRKEATKDTTTSRKKCRSTRTHTRTLTKKKKEEPPQAKEQFFLMQTWTTLIIFFIRQLST